MLFAKGSFCDSSFHLPLIFGVVQPSTSSRIVVLTILTRHMVYSPDRYGLVYSNIISESILHLLYVHAYTYI